VPYFEPYYPLLFAFVGQIVFVGMYATFPWWKSRIGRVLFFNASALALALFAALVRIRFVDSELGYRMSTVIFGIFGVAVWVQAATLIHLRTRAKKDE